MSKLCMEVWGDHYHNDDEENELGNFKENSFLSKLLSLQQDGTGAISAPTNWNEKPLLEITTRLDQDIEKLVLLLLKESFNSKEALDFNKIKKICEANEIKAIFDYWI